MHHLPIQHAAKGSMVRCMTAPRYSDVLGPAQASMACRFGTVEWVSLQQDPRCAWVRMSKPEETAAAVRGLHNTELCGQALSVYSDPFAAGHGTPTGSV